MQADKKHVLQYVMSNAAGGVGLQKAVKQAAEVFGMREGAIWDAIRGATDELVAAK